MGTRPGLSEQSIIDTLLLHAEGEGVCGKLKFGTDVSSYCPTHTSYECREDCNTCKFVTFFSSTVFTG